jgi:hypothetical protein
MMHPTILARRDNEEMDSMGYLERGISSMGGVLLA